MDFKDKENCFYIIRCRDNTFYTGYAKKLYERLKAHNSSKGAKYTRGRTPITLEYFEECEDKSFALKKEYEIKQLTRLEKSNYIKINLTKDKKKIIDEINKKLVLGEK